MFWRRFDATFLLIRWSLINGTRERASNVETALLTNFHGSL